MEKNLFTKSICIMLNEDFLDISQTLLFIVFLTIMKIVIKCGYVLYKMHNNFMICYILFSVDKYL